MSALLCCPEIDAVRDRLRTWWHGGDIGRPVMLIRAPRPEPVEQLPPVSQPEGWVTDYSTSDFDYRVYHDVQRVLDTVCFGEAVPTVAPDLAPNCVALFLGCHGVETKGTVWCEPFIEDTAPRAFSVDPENFYWRFCQDLLASYQESGTGKMLWQFPDLIEGLDTLAAMRGTDQLLYDLIENPEWVQDCLRQITDRYFYYYDILYDRMRDEVGGSAYWIWAPGRCSKLQCDFSAMIGPDMFGEFMVPVLQEMCDRIGYTLYHWDGPGAIPHLDHLLSIDSLNMIQWTPGAGAEVPADKRWWPVYHRIFDAGKRVMIGVHGDESILALKREFGPQFGSFCMSMGAGDAAEAERWLQLAAMD